FILVGLFITRYISFECVMTIEEGEVTNQIISDRTYLSYMVDGEVNGEMKRKTFEYEKLFSAALDQDNWISKFKSNHFTNKGTFNNIPFEVKFVDFIMGAQEVFEENPQGEMHLKLVESSHGERHEHYIKEGTVANIHNILYSFNKYQEGAINFTLENGQIFIQSPFAGEYMIMKNQINRSELTADGTVAPNEKQPFHYRSMYTL